jgi:hypothetical protein
LWFGETETGSAGEQPDRDSRMGCDEFSSWGVDTLPAHFPYTLKAYRTFYIPDENLERPQCLKKLSLLPQRFRQAEGQKQI